MAKILVVTSGKGGVGKTTTSAAIGTGLALRGHKTVIVDFDVGLRNLDLIMGCERRVVYDFVNVVNGEANLQQALIKDKRLENLYVLAASQRRRRQSPRRAQGNLRIRGLRFPGWYRNRCSPGDVLRRRSHRGDQPGSLLGT